MILQIILLILTILIFTLLISFIYFILNPTVISKNKIRDNLLINFKESSTFAPEKKEDVKVSSKRAFVISYNNKPFDSQPIDFNEHQTCMMIKSLYQNPSETNLSCIGLGDCVQACPQNAIIIKNNKAEVTDSCCGCGNCINICPQNIITMADKDSKYSDLFKNDRQNSSFQYQNEITEIIEWPHQKDFKLWSYCYKIIKGIK